MQKGTQVILTGISRHGKNRIEQHGNPWTVTDTRMFNGNDAFHCTSENETFSVGTQGKKIKDGRWVFLQGDPNFTFEVV
jgi:hypothetical protein